MGTKKEIVITRTLTIRTVLGMDAYQDMTPAQAVEYELGLEMEDKMQNFIEAIEWTPEGELDFSETVTVQDVYVGEK